MPKLLINTTQYTDETVSGQNPTSQPEYQRLPQKNGKVDSSSSSNKDVENTPIHAAVTAHNALPLLPPPNRSSPNSKYDKHMLGLWLDRVCQTACHELSYCWGMDIVYITRAQCREPLRSLRTLDSRRISAL